VLAVGAWSLAAAEDVEKKWRIGLSVGGYNNLDEIESDAANVLVLVDENLLFEQSYTDPRDDAAVFNKLDIQGGPIATFSAQYALTKIFVIEASVGYNKNDIGNIEVQGQFSGIDIPDLRRFNFSTFTIPAGEMTRIPVQFTALARFRPRASFNPYIGAGIGYAFVGFDPSDEFNDLSFNMDASLGGQARLTESTFGAQQLIAPTTAEIGDLQGATVDVGDTFEWHIAGGAELSFKRKWVAYLDLRWTIASRSISIGFNGGDYLGIPVPQWQDYLDSPIASETFGAVMITTGGLVDGGSLQYRPAEGESPDTNCELNPENCELFFDPDSPDGVVDPGFYYSQGGSVDYGGLALQIGVRYTF
jgi:hypothetical protein